MSKTKVLMVIDIIATFVTIVMMFVFMWVAFALDVAH